MSSMNEKEAELGQGDNNNSKRMNDAHALLSEESRSSRSKRSKLKVAHSFSHDDCCIDENAQNSTTSDEGGDSGTEKVQQQATMSSRSTGVDGDTKTKGNDQEEEGDNSKAKLGARREANRMHAFKSRQRSKMLLQELQQTVTVVTQEKIELERRIAVLSAQLDVLQQQNIVLLSQQSQNNQQGNNHRNMLSTGTATPGIATATTPAATLQAHNPNQMLQQQVQLPMTTTFNDAGMMMNAADTFNINLQQQQFQLMQQQQMARQLQQFQQQQQQQHVGSMLPQSNTIQNQIASALNTNASTNTANIVAAAAAAAATGMIDSNSAATLASLPFNPLLMSMILAGQIPSSALTTSDQNISISNSSSINSNSNSNSTSNVNSNPAPEGINLNGALEQMQQQYQYGNLNDRNIMSILNASNQAAQNANTNNSSMPNISMGGGTAAAIATGITNANASFPITTTESKQQQHQSSLELVVKQQNSSGMEKAHVYKTEVKIMETEGVSLTSPSSSRPEEAQQDHMTTTDQK